MRALTLLLCLAGLPAAAQVRLVEAGVVCPGERDGVPTAAPGTEAGFITSIEEGIAFDLPDRVVPVMEKLSFGIRVGLKDGAPLLPIRVVTTHPPMGPRGVTRQTYESDLAPGAASLRIYTFDHGYEMVEGRWTFAIEALSGDVLLEVPFDVVGRFGNARVDAVCLGNLSS
ncbi:DUF3859 domain-containing protein [Jannaschia sp. Os4]|uniref:DUF3859 domain-containing protein n=1 Tax=Jannaschia sp. Os4 TaxID=2807617 RepID=UPI001939D7A4|nr:DUF3859 domain-containing protein [Jannaschia sp. Os4]MBM2577190.1 DUF3859 domain-containing protein [Jannaschia sp. Os4]